MQRTYSWCKIKGDLVVDTENEDTTHIEIERADCRVFHTHRHIWPDGDKVESHIHFICTDKDRIDIVGMINF